MFLLAIFEDEGLVTLNILMGKKWSETFSKGEEIQMIIDEVYFRIIDISNRTKW